MFLNFSKPFLFAITCMCFAGNRFCKRFKVSKNLFNRYQYYATGIQLQAQKTKYEISNASVHANASESIRPSSTVCKFFFQFCAWPSWFINQTITRKTLFKSFVKKRFYIYSVTEPQNMWNIQPYTKLLTLLCSSSVKCIHM